MNRREQLHPYEPRALVGPTKYGSDQEKALGTVRKPAAASSNVDDSKPAK